MRGFRAWAMALAVALAFASPSMASAAKRPPTPPPSSQLGYITGTLTAEFLGTPVSGATVTAYQYKASKSVWMPVGTATTSADGTYRLELAANTYRIGFSAPWHTAEFFDNAATVLAGGDIPLAAGASSTANAELRPFGDGTQAHPFLVYDLATLDAVRANPTAAYLQVADVDAGATAVQGSALWNGGAGWIPIPSFSGTYDGANHAIIGLRAYRPRMNDGTALFGYINGTVKDLAIEDCDITARTNAAALALMVQNGASVYGCTSSGRVRVVGSWVDGLYGGANAGGLACYVAGTVADCSSSAQVDAQLGDCGGIVGTVESSGSVTRCSFTGQINPGFVLYSPGSGSRYGGIAGMAKYGVISECSVDAYIEGGYHVAGIVGYAWGPITNCYATGTLKSAGSNGGVVSWTTGEAPVSCYYDLIFAGGSTTISPFGEQKTTAEMQDPATYVGWDFDTAWNAPVPNTSYPTLR